MLWQVLFKFPVSIPSANIRTWRFGDACHMPNRSHSYFTPQMFIHSQTRCIIGPEMAWRAAGSQGGGFYSATVREKLTSLFRSLVRGHHSSVWLSKDNQGMYVLIWYRFWQQFRLSCLCRHRPYVLVSYAKRWCLFHYGTCKTWVCFFSSASHRHHRLSSEWLCVCVSSSANPSSSVLFSEPTITGLRLFQSKPSKVSASFMWYSALNGMPVTFAYCERYGMTTSVWIPTWPSREVQTTQDAATSWSFIWTILDLTDLMDVIFV